MEAQWFLGFANFYRCLIVERLGNILFELGTECLDVHLLAAADDSLCSVRVRCLLRVFLWITSLMYSDGCVTQALRDYDNLTVIPCLSSQACQQEPLGSHFQASANPW